MERPFFLLCNLCRLETKHITENQMQNGHISFVHLWRVQVVDCLPGILELFLGRHVIVSKLLNEMIHRRYCVAKVEIMALTVR